MKRIWVCFFFLNHHHLPLLYFTTTTVCHYQFISFSSSPYSLVLETRTEIERRKLCVVSVSLIFVLGKGEGARFLARALSSTRSKGPGKLMGCRDIFGIDDGSFWGLQFYYVQRI
ncbi:hypothetical protein OIU77_025820 [Salix suchowensis]|uniref:Uncharacterized protein n=2 Tax=Salix TaxID=40685 RepID=A0A9Q0TCR0_9ROSI|nr:hypothetical protein OIU77_025820 [Salix suchowensis]KAJ6709098.1 hypothetical protein OIU74_010245 [Salix koriyanagi]